LVWLFYCRGNRIIELKNGKARLKKRIFPLIFLALLMSWGCFRKSSVKIPSASGAVKSKPAPPPAVTPPVIVRKPVPLEPTPLPKTITTPGNLQLGELYFQVGKYSQAAKALEAGIRSNPDTKDLDLFMFHLGLSRALEDDSGRDFHRAEAVFKRLISDFPGSIYKDQAQLILELRAQIDKLNGDISERDERIKKLSKELQVLKDIDLQRRPSRPNE
jgi:tetratricopeptide (TPR) repeat protein